MSVHFHDIILKDWKEKIYFIFITLCLWQSFVSNFFFVWSKEKIVIKELSLEPFAASLAGRARLFGDHKVHDSRLWKDAAQSNLIKQVCVKTVMQPQPSACTRWSTRRILIIRPLCLLSVCSEPNLRIWAYFQESAPRNQRLNYSACQRDEMTLWY